MDNGQPKTAPNQNELIFVPKIDPQIIFEQLLLTTLRVDILTGIILEAKLATDAELNQKVKIGLTRLVAQMDMFHQKFNTDMQKLMKEAKEKQLSNLLDKVEPRGGVN